MIHTTLHPMGDNGGMEYMVLAVIVVAAIVALSAVSRRIGVAPPLILMLVGVAISFLPFVDIGPINPEWILMGILPPLLYVGAISIPTVELRRDLPAVGGLAIILVVLSAVILGFVIHWLIPGVSLPYGIALGAILSPTDAAATTIVKRLGVPGRVGIILQGESLLNDATALVLLRSAIAATAVTVSLWHVVLNFLWAAGVATIIGVFVGWAGVRVRGLLHDPAPTTALSFLIPFVAYVPSELANASGLVAVVAAGIAATQLGPKHLDARQRISERENWHTMEFLLEGAVFLGMGLELSSLIVDLYHNHETLWLAIGVAALAILITLVVRAAYLAILLAGTKANLTRKAERSQHWKRVGETVRQGPDADLTDRQRDLLSRRAEARTRMEQADPQARQRWENRMTQMRTRVKRFVADVDYLIRQPLGLKEGTLLTWAGMRGVVTLAAAQTLPTDTAHRSLLILIAFFVAAGSLILQGGTLPWVVKALGLAGKDTAPPGEWERLQQELDQAAQDWKPPEGKTIPDEWVPLARLRARRQALIELRSDGTYSSVTLSTAWDGLDAEEMGLQLRLKGGH